MSKFLAVLLLVVMVLGSVFATAEAARFGGGRSFGVSRSVNSFSRTSQAARPMQAATSPNRWLAPLAGLAIGGLLASLFMGHGLGTGLLTWLVVLGAGFMIWNLFRNKLKPGFQQPSQYQQYQQSQSYRQGNVYDAQSHFTRTNDQASNASYPAGFYAETFLRDAKVQFIRLQAAFDAKDLKDLREFTAPEVFAEIQIQLQERGQQENKTEVVSLEAELLDVTTEMGSSIASVKFSGMIKEEVNTPAAPFTEAWHFRKENAEDKWIVTGVQQNIH